jgi:hypothetical protein
VDGLASHPPHEGTRHVGEAPSCLAAAMLVRGERKLPRAPLLVRVLFPLYLSKEYHIVKRVLTMRCLPPGKFIVLFRRVP